MKTGNNYPMFFDQSTVFVICIINLTFLLKINLPMSNCPDILTYILLAVSLKYFQYQAGYHTLWNIFPETVTLQVHTLYKVG